MDFISKPSFSKPWPDEATDEEKSNWVSEFLLSELPEYGSYSVKKLGAGFVGVAFSLEAPSDNGKQRLVFQRALYPKHRAFVFHQAAIANAPKMLYAGWHPAYQSVSVSEFADKGELMSYDVYSGGKDGNKPPVEMMDKCGRMLARLHNIDQAWHKDFATREAAASAGVPEGPDFGFPLNDLLFAYDLPDRHVLTQTMSVLTGFASEESMAAAGIDKNYVVSESSKIFSHDILPQEGWTTRTVSLHGDLHGANIVVSGEDNPLAIDFECSGPGPAGWDLAHLYLHVRSLEPEHDYDRSYALCKGYLSEITKAETPEQDDIESLLFDVLAWQYVVGIKQWTCQLITEAVGQQWAPEKKAEALRLLKKDALNVYVARIQEARTNADLRAELIKTGRVVP